MKAIQELEDTDKGTMEDKDRFFAWWRGWNGQLEWVEPEERICGACWIDGVRHLKTMSKKESMRKYRATPQGKAKQKEYQRTYAATPQGKARRKECGAAYYQKNKARVAARQKEYYASPQGKATRKKYEATPHGKAKKKEYQQKYRATPHGKARTKEWRTRRTKRFRAANPPHDHDDKTNYHDDDLIKYQWKSIHDKRLGCSKCRWSVKGCLECRLRRWSLWSRACQGENESVDL